MLYSHGINEKLPAFSPAHSSYLQLLERTMKRRFVKFASRALKSAGANFQS